MSPALRRILHAVALAAVALGALAAFTLGAGLALAQQALRTWTDSSGRVSIDLSDSAWRAYANPSPDQPDMVVMLTPPRQSETETGPPSHFCALTQTRQPSDRPAAQTIANEMIRLATRLDDTAARVENQDAPPAELVERDGVVSSYTSDVVTDPSSGQSVTRLRRYFILANTDSLEWYKTTCLAFPAAGPDAPAVMRGVMERMRVVGVSHQ